MHCLILVWILYRKGKTALKDLELLTKLEYEQKIESKCSIEVKSVEIHSQTTPKFIYTDMCAYMCAHAYTCAERMYTR